MSNAKFTHTRSRFRDLQASLLLAAVYFLLGIASIQLAIPPGYAAALFPGAGVAFGAVMFFGLRLLPGLWLGALSLNLWIAATQGGLNGKNILLAVLIACGSTLQTRIAVALVWRRLHDAWRDLDNDHSIVLLLFLAGPLACLVSASWANCMLLLFEALAPAEFLFNWWNWWVGDTIGVLVFAPLTFIVLQSDNPLWQSRLKTVALPSLLVMVGIVVAFVYVSRIESERVQQRVAEHGAALSEQLRIKLLTYSEIVASVSNLVLTVPNLNSAVLEQFSRASFANHTDLYALSWNLWVTQAERGRIETELSKELQHRDFHFTQRDETGQIIPAATRERYVVVRYISPLTKNLSAVGYDIASDAVRAAAIATALKTGKPAATAPIQLVQEQGGSVGILLLHPVYFNQRSTPAGFAVGVFRLEALLAQQFGSAAAEEINFLLEDKDLQLGGTLYQSGPSMQPELAALRWENDIFFNGRRWHLAVYPTPAFVTANRSLFAWMLLAVGFMLIGLLQAFLLAMTGRTSVIQRQVKEQTKTLQRANEKALALLHNASDGIHIIDINGYIIEASASFCSMLGYARSEVLGMHVSQWDVGFADVETQMQIVRAQFEHAVRSQFETRHRRKDGSVIDVEVSGFPLEMDGQRVLFNSSRDIGERLRLHESLRTNEQKLRNLFELSPIGIALADGNGHFLEINHSFQQITGYSAAALSQLDYERLLPDNCQSMSALKHKALSDTGHFGPYEKEFLHPDGNSVSLRINGMLVTGTDEQEYIWSMVENIGDWKKSEQALKRNDRLLREAQQAAHIGCYITNLETGTWVSTATMDDIFGIDETYPHTLDSWANFLHPDFIQPMTEAIQKVIHNKTPFDQEYIMIRPKDGAERWMHGLGQVILDESTNAISLLGTVQDITQRKQTELALYKSEQLFKEITESSPLAIAIWNGPEQRFSYLNPTLLQLFGYDLEDLPTLADWWPKAYPDPEYRQWVQQQWERRVTQQLQTRGAFEPIEVQVTCKNGAIKTILWGFSLVNEQEMAYGLDLTELKQTESSLRASEEKFQRIAECAPMPILVTEADSAQAQNVLYLNPKFSELFGYTLEDIASVDAWWTLAFPEATTRTAIRTRWQEAIAEAQQHNVQIMPQEVSVTCKDGSLRNIEFRVATTGDANVIMGTDFTERKAQEEQLSQYRHHLEELVEEKTRALSEAKDAAVAFGFLSDQALELARSGYWCIDFHVSDSHYISSERTVEIFGDPPRENFRYDIMQDWYVNIAAADPAAAEATLKNYWDALAGLIARYDMIHPYKRPCDGRIIWVHVLGQVVRDADGRPTNVYGVVMDVTTTKLAEIAIRESKEVALQASQAKSDFLANMSHEIRTPMNGVIGMIDVLIQSNLNDEQLQMAQVIRDSAYAQLAIINDILDFSKIEAGKMQLSPEPFLLEAVLENVFIMLEKMAHDKKVHLKLFVDPKIPALIVGDAQRLRQILTNLINNAIKFSSGLGYEGEVYVRAELIRLRDKVVWISLVVRDNGIGITEDAQLRLFQRFEQADSSTTRTYGGTGLGLVICQRLVEMMQGKITLQSRVQQGSEFSLVLPFPLVDELSQPQAELSLAGLACLLIGPSTQLTRDISQHLTHAGATLTQLHSVAEINTLSVPQESLWIWVFDLFGTPSVEELRTAAIDYQQTNAQPMQIQHLAIGRGKRHKARMLATDVAQIDGNLLTRRSVVQSVAQLAGRCNTRPSILPPSTAAFVKQPSATRVQAIQNDQLILVAEDNEVNQQVIREQLKLLGLFADIAVDGREAFSFWMREPYALILSDLHMPHLDGYQLAAAIRHEEAKSGRRKTPIIALTAVAMKGEAEHCQAMGMDDYLSKPTPISELEAMLRKWLPQAQLVRAQLPVSDADAKPSITEWDPDRLARMVGNDPAKLQRFFTLFVQNGDEQTQQLALAISANDKPAIQRAAHSFKSSARSVGALRLSELCAELELAAKRDDSVHCTTLAEQVVAAFAQVKHYIAQREPD